MLPTLRYRTTGNQSSEPIDVMQTASSQVPVESPDPTREIIHGSPSIAPEDYVVVENLAPDITAQQHSSNQTQGDTLSPDQRGPTQEKPGLREKPSAAEDAPTDDTELLRGIGRGAQVWTTYVKETMAFDEDQVDGWNRSLDVTLVFAALFSAILTAFVLESVKSLKPDPSEATSESLVEITRILRVIASGQPQIIEQPNPSNRTGFHPKANAVWVNSLWFLSLSLSVAVSLAAMLAKQWCYYFLSGRTGDPISQAEERQRRFNGIAKWRMRGILEMLPVIMHISLALFSVGLVLYLREINLAVAATVSVVALSTIGFYAVTTLLPVKVLSCPFITPQAVYMRIAVKTAGKYIPGLASRLVASSSEVSQRTSDNAPMVSTSRFSLEIRQIPAVIGTFFANVRQLLRSPTVASPSNHSIQLQNPDTSDIEAQTQEVLVPPRSSDDNGDDDDDDETEPWVVGSLAWLINHSQNLNSIDTAIGALAIGKVHFKATLIDREDLKEKINSHLVKHLSYCFKSHKEHGVKLHLLDNRTHKASALDYIRWMTYFADSNPNGISKQILDLHRSLGINLLTHLGLSFASVSETMDLAHEDSNNIAMWLSALIDHYDHERIYFSEQVVSTLIDGLTAASIKLSPGDVDTAEYAKGLAIPQLIRILWKVSHIHESQLRSTIVLNLATFALKAKLHYPFNPERKGYDAVARHLLFTHRAGKLFERVGSTSLLIFSLLGLLHPKNHLEFDGQSINTIASIIRETRFFFRAGNNETLSIPEVVRPGSFRRDMAVMLLEVMISFSIDGPHPDRPSELLAAMRELQLSAFWPSDYTTILLGVDYWGDHKFKFALHAVCHLIYDHLYGKITLHPDVLTATTELLLGEVEKLGQLDTTILDLCMDKESQPPPPIIQADITFQDPPPQPELVASSTLALILSESKDEQCIEAAVRAVLRHSNDCGPALVVRAIMWFAKRFPVSKTSWKQVEQEQLLSVSGYTRILTSMIMHCSNIDELAEKLHDLSRSSGDDGWGTRLEYVANVFTNLSRSREDPHVRAFGIAGLAVWRLQATYTKEDPTELDVPAYLSEVWSLLAERSASKLRSEELEVLLDTTVLLAAFKQPVPRITPESAQLILALLKEFRSASETHARPALAVAVTFWGLSCEQDDDEWEFWTHEARKMYWRHYSHLPSRREDAAALFLLGLSRLLAHYSNLLLSHASVRTIAEEIGRYMNFHSTKSTRLTLYFLPKEFDVRRHVRESVWEYLQQTQGHGPFTKSASDTRDQLRTAITLDGGEGYIYEKPQPFVRRTKDGSNLGSRRGVNANPVGMFNSPLFVRLNSSMTTQSVVQAGHTRVSSAPNIEVGLSRD